MRRISFIGYVFAFFASLTIGNVLVAGSDPSDRVKEFSDVVSGFSESTSDEMSTQPARSEADAESNLYVVLGGNGTCRQNTTSRTVPGLLSVKLFDAFNSWILTSGVFRESDNVIYACYEWLSPQMQFYDLRAGLNRMTPIHESELDALVIGRAQNVRKIIIIGHSHAGWRAMKLASSPDLLNATNVPILLASMDPVSRVTCQQVRQPGCREAPRDFTAEEFYQLNTRTTWLNIYHLNAVFLGSGPIAAAHYNTRVFVNHIAMENNNYIWSLVTRFVSDNLWQ